MTKFFDIFGPLNAKAILRQVGLGLFAAALFIAAAPSPAAAQTAAAQPEKKTEVKKYNSDKEYYAAQTKILINKEVEKITKKLERTTVSSVVSEAFSGAGIQGSTDYGRIQESLEKLRNAANGEQVYNSAGLLQFSTAEGQYLNKWGMDSTMEDIVENLQSRVNDALKNKVISQEEANMIMEEGARLYNTGVDRAIEAYKADGKKGCGLWGTDCEKRLEQARADTLADENIIVGRQCPTVPELREKYQSDCWSCLVVERLVSAFLNTAEDAYGLAQRAGLVLLAIGTVMWILLWGLKNVSSLTQLEPANILNDLVKFAFKLALAYFFITNGLTPVREYFITPIMGTGAVIAQQFWPKTFTDNHATEDFIWENHDFDEIQKSYEDAQKEQNKFINGETSATGVDKPLEVSDEDAKKLEIAKKKALASLPADGTNIQIPAFQLPGAAGTFVSPFGCRPAPVTQGNRKGSSIHKGVDIAAGAGTPVYAIGSGRITYSNSRSGGYMATIVHDDGSKKWVSMYMHMQPKSSGFAVNFNRKANPNAEREELFHVAQGQQIGFVGNTGNSGGNHLHLAIKYNGDLVDPLNLIEKKIVYAPRNCPVPTTEANRTKPPAQFKRDQTKFSAKGIGVGGTGTVDLSSTFVSGSEYGKSTSSLVIDGIGDIKYTGSTQIMPLSVMNSILGATKVITDTTAENLVLGNAITCYASLDKGGAWHAMGMSFTNVVMWIEGALIWCTGFLLTLAVVYYLMDISFKIGFAVIALPIVVGLWPFNLTKGKFSICVSIIAKAAATFAFLAITTSYAMNLVSSALVGRTDDGAVEVSSVTGLTDHNESGGGLQLLLEKMDSANYADSRDANQDNIDYVANRLAVFSFDFIILMFCFIYSYKLIQATVPQFVNKFFPDKAFGDAQPMHHWSTAATRWVQKQVTKPAALAKDIALHQGGKMAMRTVSGTVNMMRGKSTGGNAAGSTTKAAGSAVKGVGQGVEGAGKGIKAVSKAANAIPVVGQAIAAAGTAVGTAVEAGGKAIKQAGDTIKKTGEQINKIGGRNLKNKDGQESDK